MNKLTGSQVRETWIKFFEGKGHHYIPGVSLIPKGDKSLLWVNAGVTGLKKYFDGSEIPPCRRIVNVQKSIRTNDIENVGHTARHHTFFEMLGNFSIGDYFRKEVIFWAFEILTDEKTGFGMPKDKLYMTYNPSDLESYQYWQEAGVTKDHLIPLEGNYWQIGEGPCGPNTEVFFDRGEKYDPNHIGVRLLKEDMENDRFVEIWGIVFSQFNAVNGVKREDYKELPSKNIDTGAGLERITCVLQETETNFETDLFMPIIESAMKISGQPYEGKNLMAFRVIADHARCLTFALNDGARFSNEGRGYVLRRIIRRAMRYGQKLGIHEPFMHKLLPVVAENYASFYPELSNNIAESIAMVKGEEEKFLKTLTSGEEMLQKMLVGKTSLSGEDVFKLYDTYGFPADLTKEIAAENGVIADMDGFEEKMEEQKERARNARGEIESFHKQSKDLLAFKVPSTFVYGETTCLTTTIGLFQNGVKVESIDEKGEAVFEKTPFYAEMGGQVSDTGIITSDGFKALVTYCGKTPSGAHLHEIEVEFGVLKIGQKVTLHIDENRRQLIERNHSATHLLHAALSSVLGSHVRQEGSFVNEEYLRFDFSSQRKLTKEELNKIERLVNEKISASIPQSVVETSLEEAVKLGAEMEFGDKYGSVVRVVSFGDFSKEFCGGTHVNSTSDIGVFSIVSEEAIASGVRRISGLTSIGAYEALKKRTLLLETAEESLLASDTDLLKRLALEKERVDACEKELKSLKDKLAASKAKDMAKDVKVINGISFVEKKVNGASRSDLLNLLDSLKGSLSNYVIALVGVEENSFPLLIGVGGEALKKKGAGQVMKEFSKLLGGSGGGRPEMASGSGKNLDRLDESFKILEESFK